MKKTNQMNIRGKLFQSIPMDDVKQIIRFEKIIRNYIEMCKILNKKSKQ
jgi:hypothetical protein